MIEEGKGRSLQYASAREACELQRLLGGDFGFGFCLGWRGRGCFGFGADGVDYFLGGGDYGVGTFEGDHVGAVGDDLLGANGGEVS